MRVKFIVLGFLILILGLSFISPTPQKNEKENKKENYWLVLNRKSNTEILYFGTPGERDNSRVERTFQVKSGNFLNSPTPLPKLLGRKYWLITKKEVSEIFETAPYFLTLDIPFSVNTNGSGFTLLHEFAGGVDDGRSPYSSTLALSENTLYGMTTAGGDDNLGIIFSFAIPTTPSTPVVPTQSSSISSGCSSEKPSKAADLFQIDTTSTNGVLYFAPAGNPVNKYAVSYGFVPAEERFGAIFDQANPAGVNSLTINDLSPNTTYYFKVLGINGCMPGDWSNEMKIITPKSSKGGITYYKSFMAKILSFFPHY